MQDTGLVKTYYDNNEIEEEYFQINGKKNGLYTLYDIKGFIIRTIEYVDNNKHGEYISYHNCNENFISNKINRICYKCYYNNGIKEGPAIFYHDNGQIDNICHYENGKITGMRYWYYQSKNDSKGCLKKSCNYIDGLIQGEFIYYNQDGTIKSVWNYVDDEILT